MKIEYRATDGASNIYIASALLLKAGLDGVARQIEPIPSTKENIDLMSSKRKES